MKVLVVGSGGREHALAWKLAQSELVETVLAVPGNPGISGVATVLGGDPDVHGIAELAAREQVDLVVIGPEAPLVAGLADLLRERGLRVFGPGAAAARLEGSKSFAKDFMRRHGVPTGRAEAFTDEGAALEYLESLSAPPVVKMVGLAAGKGVTVAESMDEAAIAIRAAFRAAPGPGVLLEERLFGQELSLLVLTDGTAVRPLLMAQDYKQLRDGDEGPMTGGMGAVAPAQLLSPEQMNYVMDEVVGRTIAGLAADGLEFRGVLFFGLMVTADGVKVLEYNVRFGDPEAQSVLPLLRTDFVEVVTAVADGTLADIELEWSRQYAVGVVMSAPGYPEAPRRGVPLALPAASAAVHVFHAGTAIADSQLVSNGGRVLNVVALAPTLREAIIGAYATVERVDFPGAHWRTDIGARLDTPGARYDVVSSTEVANEHT